jgi:flavin reductase (DIM6/NTAB) family NADH-FMN oxidoreductase RutF
MNEESHNPTHLGADALRAVFRLHASGVAVITGVDDKNEPLGFTATSVTSLGSNPPLVSFNIAQGSSTYAHLRIGAKMAVHTLGTENLDLAQRMAGPKENRFSTSDWETGPFGIPVFSCATSYLVGTIREVFTVESNAIVVMAVESAFVNSEEQSPLLYFQRGYLTIGTRLKDNF